MTLKGEQMNYFKTCPYCGANLDPGEVCDCRDKAKTPAGAANAGEGRVEHVDHDVSTSSITHD